MVDDANAEARRRQIAEAVWSLAAKTGLEAVTMRQVADEAGVSMRLVQYYFGTRTSLLLGALELLNAQGEKVARRRVARVGAAPSVDKLVRAVLLELLPLDDERRRRYMVHAAYFVRLLTDADLRAGAPAGSSLESMVADLLRMAPEPPVDARAEADLLVALAFGLQTQVLVGHLSQAKAKRLLDLALSRALPSAQG